eukprot:CAMPEP_0173436538 /NCGR_PEP_ID=MMETSP1357-20121228/16349_1 /TAXON_ID=77926 /ORGANISM="Hemiselmis rufescens, Strain PCC563" /LENGTH=119 /DNA_ID=CAMNT_0014401627 /DNA_START=22 /DNA_END=381 /DNA_ORIENTATION=+
MRTVAALALIGSAAAFNAPTMVTRRDAVVTGGAAAVVAPLLKPSEASAARVPNGKFLKAPIVEVFDERDGCAGAPAKKGNRFGRGDRDMCIKVSMKEIGLSTANAVSVKKNYGIVRYGI